MIETIKLDEKSLYYGIHNDYSRGQSATVATPINQSSDPAKWHHDVMNVLSANPGLDIKQLPETLVDACLRKTTSQSGSVLSNFYIFQNIAFDGKPLKTDRAFAIYVKKEIDEFIKNRSGEIVKNTHLGRLKLHYPTRLKYVQDGYNIDNGKVLHDILQQNGGFAFVVRAIEVDVANSYINFATSIVGPEGVLLSNVFKRQKGVGKKLLLNEVNPWTYQDLLSSQSTLDDIDPAELVKDKNGIIDFEAINRTRIKNGERGELYAIEHLGGILGANILSFFHTSAEYRTSPYDIEYFLESETEKRYLEVKSTSGSKKVFNMSMGEIKFMDKYSDRYLLLLITRVNDRIPTIDIYDKPKILKMRKEHPTTRFYAN